MQFIKKHPAAAYFILAFGLTWAGSLVVFFATPRGSSASLSLLSFPGMLVWYYGPFAAALIVTRASDGPGSMNRLLRRFLEWRFGWRWYAFIFLYPLALHLVVVGVDRLFGGPAPVFFQAAGVPEGNMALVLAGLFLWQMLQRGVGEETGWRGFALPFLQARRTPLSASLQLGVLWGLWHFHPANFSALLSPAGVFIFINIVLTTILFTWLYNHTRGSLLAAALFHSMLNLAEYVIPIGLADASLSRSLVQAAALLVTAALLVCIAGPGLGMNRREKAAAMTAVQTGMPTLPG